MIKSKHLINYFILLLIVTSGSVFFTLRYSKETRRLLMISALLVLLYNIIRKNVKFNKMSISKLLLLITLMSASFLVNTQNGIDTKNLLLITSVMASVFILKEGIRPNIFKVSYVKIMLWICIISLVCYALSSIIPISKFPFYHEEQLGVDVFRYTFYHSWGWGIGTLRNPGIFWEPGVFECYINLAILFLIFDRDNSIANKKYYYLIFISTLITTQSTTGYIIAGLILLYATLTFKIAVKNNIIRIFIVVFSILGVLFFINSNVVSDKFNQDNGSYSARTADLTQSLDMIKESPILGIGYLSDKQILEQQIRNIEKNSNGLLIFIIQFGLIIFMIYFTFLYKGIKSFFNVKFIDALFILLVIMIMFSSEPLVLYSIWMYFLY
ncbi:O-antigen ligase family protein [Neobacillus pocheonensis]|uniref:O-antigen ligase family protein n=1 Tax=Neobacillus pocheonensis TaxID=363869 RepID=A0ABT0WL48_9BACI|nr:O-antigen ligase family protein [Neobacillus pocheonensis]